MGLCNGKIKYTGSDITDIAYKSAVKVFKKYQSSIITIIYGADATEADAEEVKNRLAEKYGDDVEISIVNGGQPIYYFIISVE